MPTCPAEENRKENRRLPEKIRNRSVNTHTFDASWHSSSSSMPSRFTSAWAVGWGCKLQWRIRSYKTRHDHRCVTRWAGSVWGAAAKASHLQPRNAIATCRIEWFVLPLHLVDLNLRQQPLEVRERLPAEQLVERLLVCVLVSGTAWKMREKRRTRGEKNTRLHHISGVSVNLIDLLLMLGLFHHLPDRSRLFHSFSALSSFFVASGQFRSFVRSLATFRRHQLRFILSGPHLRRRWRQAYRTKNEQGGMRLMDRI
jgi:hypothetical protein